MGGSIGKNISKRLKTEYGLYLIQIGTDAIKTSSKRVIQKQNIIL